ncbi:uncharacterized protein LOC144444277, partial [Glandiceps talaboti]
MLTLAIYYAIYWLFICLYNPPGTYGGVSVIDLWPGNSHDITTQNYPANYPDNVILGRVVRCLGKYRKITVTFHDFDTQYGADFFSAGYGDTTIITSWSGTTAPPDFISTEREVWFWFSSDNSTSSRGFNLTVTSGTSGGVSVIDLLPGIGHDITTQNYPANYPDNVILGRVVRCDGHCRKIMVTFHDFDTQYGADFFSAGYGDIIIISSWSGTTAPPDFTSTEMEIWFLFSSGNSTGSRGFNLTVYAESYVGESNINLLPGHRLNITTQNYPANYPLDVNWKWTVSSSEKIMVTFYDFDTQFGYDSLSAGYGNTTVIQRWSGTTAPKDFISTEREVWFQFYSDSIVVRRGFHLTVYAEGTSDGVSHIIVLPGDSFNITTPNYPANYPDNGMWRWLARSIETIIVTFHDFDSEYDADIFSAGYGDTRTITSWSGTTAPQDFTSTEGEVWFSFSSDNSTSSRGFHLTVHAEEEEEEEEEEECDDLSWGLYQDKCFRINGASNRNSAESGDIISDCQTDDYSFLYIKPGKEMEHFMYYVNYIWRLGIGKIIQIHRIINITEVSDLIDITWVDNKTSCQENKTLDENDACVGSDMCLVLETTTMTFMLMECNDTRISFTLCVKLAIGKTSSCGIDNFSCGSKECINKAYVCDGVNDCLDNSDEADCVLMGSQLFFLDCPSSTFRCSNGGCISLSFYCDFIDHCGDNSDESHCVYPNCTSNQFACDNGQCLNITTRCNFIKDCRDGSDENDCEICRGFRCYSDTCLPDRAVCDGIKDCVGNQHEDEPNCGFEDDFEGTQTQCKANKFRCHFGNCIDRQWMCIYDFDEYGYQVGCRDVTHLQNCDLYQCPAGMFKCPSSYCIPLHRHCDGVQDCAYGQDEQNCDKGSNMCEGDYKCHGSDNCIPVRQQCDGIKHCPNGDDEILCGVLCPKNCLCDGYIIECISNEMLDFPDDIDENTRKITFTGNNMNMSGVSFDTYKFLGELDLTNNVIRSLAELMFFGLRKLQKLYLSGNGIIWIGEGSFDDLGNLHLLNLTGNLFNVRSSVLFEPLVNIKKIYTDAYKYCCLVRKYHQVEVCTPHADVFSSCEDLMANKIQRSFIWILGFLAFLGNIFVIIWRIKKNDLKNVPNLLVWNLAVADLLMGIYLLIIASADMYYRGEYIQYDDFWRSSSLCSFAGFLSTLSSEVSVFTLTVMTIDRFVIIVFPFKFIRLKLKTCTYLIVVGWILVAVVSFLPLVGISYFGESFYGRSAVCLSLHLTNESTPGWEFSVGIFLALNFLSFILIFVCYLLMYVSVRRSKKASGLKSSKSSKAAATIAKRMTLIVLTDFCCWVPITVMGILALTDAVTIPGIVYAWTAVFILPFNSAMNPILYTISTINFKKTTTKAGQHQSSEVTRNVSQYQMGKLRGVSQYQIASLFINEIPTSHVAMLEGSSIYTPLSIHIERR